MCWVFRFDFTAKPVVCAAAEAEEGRIKSKLFGLNATIWRSHSRG